MPGYEIQIHYDGTMDQWQKLVESSECDSIDCIFCRDGALLPFSKKKLTYYDSSTKFDLLEKEVFKKLLENKNHLTRIELIEILVDLWNDSSEANQYKITETYLACIHTLKNISDVEFEQLKEKIL